MRTLTLAIRGMSCASCASRVESALKGVPGVREAAVNLATEKATVRGEGLDRAALARAVADAGYQALSELSPEELESLRSKELARLKRAFWLSAACSAPILALSMIPALRPRGADLLLFSLASAVQFGPGLRFYRLGWSSAGRRSPDMNTLVMLGTNAAYLYSVLSTFAPSLLPLGSAHAYYESAAVIITLILGGKTLEVAARGKASRALRALASLRPKTARVLRSGFESEIPLSELKPGDTVLLKPGERIPCDGEVLEGEGFVDESMLTGEPIPAGKKPGSRLAGGTVNLTGALRFKAMAVGEDTALADILRAVEAAQGDKPPIQRLADRVVALFVPIVLAIALLAFAAWLALGSKPALPQALTHAVAVLIVACPCAIGLATPAAVMAATSKAAEVGVVFRSAEALEALAKADILLLDKTGTLTQGRPVLTDVACAPGLSREEALGMAAALESGSEHPLARAVVRAASEEGLAIPAAQGFKASPGLGAEAEVSGRRVLIGAERFLEKLGAKAGALASQTERLEQAGKSLLYLAVDGKLAAALAVSDPLKGEARDAVAELKALGCKTVLVSGDRRVAAEAIAREAGMADVLAEVLPEGKAEAVKAYQKKGRVAFVGDGLNDAPALAQADAGVALGTGTDAAAEAADVVILSGNLEALPRALALSRRALSTIRQNLFWAFFYNALLIPLAAGAFEPVFRLSLSPMLAALAMSLSSVFVLSNSLRLKALRI